MMDLKRAANAVDGRRLKLQALCGLAEINSSIIGDDAATKVTLLDLKSQMEALFKLSMAYNLRYLEIIGKQQSVVLFHPADLAKAVNAMGELATEIAKSRAVLERLFPPPPPDPGENPLSKALREFRAQNPHFGRVSRE